MPLDADRRRHADSMRSAWRPCGGDTEFAARRLQGESNSGRRIRLSSQAASNPDFSLEAAGRSQLLVGASGSGKSTVAKLLAGLLRAVERNHPFDGIPRKELPRRMLTNSVAPVDQGSAFRGDDSRQHRRRTTRGGVGHGAGRP